MSSLTSDGRIKECFRSRSQICYTRTREGAKSNTATNKWCSCVVHEDSCIRSAQWANVADASNVRALLDGDGYLITVGITVVCEAVSNSDGTTAASIELPAVGTCSTKAHWVRNRKLATRQCCVLQQIGEGNDITWFEAQIEISHERHLGGGVIFLNFNIVALGLFACRCTNGYTYRVVTGCKAGRIKCAGQTIVRNTGTCPGNVTSEEGLASIVVGIVQTQGQRRIGLTNGILKGETRIT